MSASALHCCDEVDSVTYFDLQRSLQLTWESSVSRECRLQLSVVISWKMLCEMFFLFFHFNDCPHSNKLSVSCMPRYVDLLQQDFEEPPVRLVISIPWCILLLFSQLSGCLLLVPVQHCLQPELNRWLRPIYECACVFIAVSQTPKDLKLAVFFFHRPDFAKIERSDKLWEKINCTSCSVSPRSAR